MNETNIIEWLKFFLALGTGVATAIWALHKWLNQQTEKQHEDQKRLSALYVNPFLLACEELQSRFYNIISYNGLEPLNARYPNGSYAEEILYLIAQYFGWQQCIYRYSKYAQDAKLLQLTESVSHYFATDSIEIGPLCFFRPEQRSLGRLAIERTPGQYGTEFETISLVEFQRRLDESGYNAKDSVRETLELLRQANDISDLPDPVCKRMCLVQNHLVKLLIYLEANEKITFFKSESHKERLLAELKA